MSNHSNISRNILFAREYVIDFNGTKAAIRAGYSKTSAHTTACRLLKTPKVRAELARVTAKRQEKLELSADKVINELQLMGFANMQDYIRVHNGDPYVDLSKMTREQAAAVQEITSEIYMDGKGEEAREVKRTKFKLSDKVRPLELLGKYLNMFNDSSLSISANNLQIVNMVERPKRQELSTQVAQTNASESTA